MQGQRTAHTNMQSQHSVAVVVGVADVKNMQGELLVPVGSPDSRQVPRQGQGRDPVVASAQQWRVQCWQPFA